MDTFKHLEENFGQLHVTLVDPHLKGSGILTLRGADTKLSLTTSDELKHELNLNGWFDLRLVSDNDELIHLHNALYLRERFSPPGETTHRYEIYPNIVVLGAEALTLEGHVASVSFTSHRLREFFRYEVVEMANTLGRTPRNTRVAAATPLLSEAV